ncbi:sugar transferase [Nostocaceae cyanobacterium CENA369]|uniref:Sugar transferase n=1 Tax=Dendronalium phyllosphericum CENA369 TaxID=1725256 RepID=A0A8J7HZ55_9NOST|nr:sugar transferase [Dendronalium phyllosphericum]MBH8572999.1 sugar transferase [Dendronalium phyllosphericum CENA369]
MVYSNISIASFKPDLRSAKNLSIQRGLFIRLMRVVTLIFLDAIFISSAWNLAILYGTPFDFFSIQNSSFVLLNVSLTIAIFQTTNLYKAGIHRRNYLGVVKAISLSSLLLLFIDFLYKPNSHISYSSYLIYWLLSIVFICSVRYLFNLFTNFVRQRGAVRHRIFIIADEQEKEPYYIKLLERQNYFAIQGYANSRCLDLGNRETTFEYLRSQNVDEVFVSWDTIKNRLFLCWHFYNAGITLRMLPTMSEFSLPKSTFDMIGEVFYPTIPAPIIVGGDFWMKRFFDLCFSITLIFLLLPVYLAIALIIKLDSRGPIFFRQKRIGLHGKEFQIWKFRTMVTNAEKIQASLEAKNEMKDGVFFKMKDDPRITKVGKYLRLYSLDELPQLFNVFLGEMSLVGPRPLPIRDVKKFKTNHFIRQEVLPGITGLWQVSGRSNIDNFEDAFKLDMDYIENWSIWLDLKILLQTVKVVLQKTGAH